MFSSKKLIFILLGLALASGLFFSITSPDNLPVALLMIPVILVFFIGVVTSLLFMKLTGTGGGAQRQKALGALGGSVAAFCLVFQSTGGIVAGDIVLMSLIIVISYVYISRY